MVWWCVPAMITLNAGMPIQTHIGANSDHCERTQGDASNPSAKRRSTRTFKWYSRETLSPLRYTEK